jgi:hypothetical protein
MYGLMRLDVRRLFLCLTYIAASQGVAFSGQLRYRFEGRLSESIDWRDQFVTAPPPIGPGKISGFFSIDSGETGFSPPYSPRLQVEGNGSAISNAHTSMIAAFGDVLVRGGEYRDQISVALGFAHFRDLVFAPKSDSGFSLETPGAEPIPPPIPAADPGYGVLINLIGPQTWFGSYSEGLLAKSILNYQDARMWIDSSPFLDGGYGPYRELEFIRIVAVPEHTSGLLMAAGIVALVTGRFRSIV